MNLHAAVPILACSLLLAACGGSDSGGGKLADYEVSEQKADAGKVVLRILDLCADSSVSGSEAGAEADKLLAIQKKLGDQGSITSQMRDAAQSLRQCDQTDAAERLSESTDG